MKKLLLILLLLCNIVVACSNENQGKLHYLVREPKAKTAHPPAIILLHGYGSNEADLFSMANQFPEKYLVIAARAPITLSESSYAWYPIDFSNGKLNYNQIEAEKSRLLLIDFIQELKVTYGVNSKDIILFGFSQGAILSYSIGLTRPDLVKGIAVMSGRLLDEIKSKTASQENLKSLSIFISHGLNDNKIPVQNARDANAFLISIKLNPSYKEYPEGHGINAAMMKDFLIWLAQ